MPRIAAIAASEESAKALHPSSHSIFLSSLVPSASIRVSVGQAAAKQSKSGHQACFGNCGLKAEAIVGPVVLRERGQMTR